MLIAVRTRLLNQQLSPVPGRVLIQKLGLICRHHNRGSHLRSIIAICVGNSPEQRRKVAGFGALPLGGKKPHSLYCDHKPMFCMETIKYGEPITITKWLLAHTRCRCSFELQRG